jgi:nucleoid-associated protein YgaU
VIYTTKTGDSLWKIAGEQCGSASRAVVDQIKAMNKDVLKNGETIHPAMKLKLPPRTVASAN